MGFIRFKSSSPAGDLISFMAGIRQMCKDTGQKAVIYQQLNVPGVGIQGSNQPFTDSEGQSVLMGEEMFKKLKPLIESQEYVESFTEYHGQPFEVDFDKVRGEVFTGQPNGSLGRYPFYVFPQMACNLSQAWMEVPKAKKHSSPYRHKAIINRTFRYFNSFTDYYFLKKYESDLIFAGLENEYQFFCKRFNLNIPQLKIDNFYELAIAINDCKFVLANQSMIFQIAESLKVPRILEVFQLIPNVQPIGENAFDFYHSSACEYYFEKLMKQ